MIQHLINLGHLEQLQHWLFNLRASCITHDEATGVRSHRLEFGLGAYPSAKESDIQKNHYPNKLGMCPDLDDIKLNAVDARLPDLTAATIKTLCEVPVKNSLDILYAVPGLVGLEPYRLLKYPFANIFPVQDSGVHNDLIKVLNAGLQLDRGAPVESHAELSTYLNLFAHALVEKLEVEGGFKKDIQTFLELRAKNPDSVSKLPCAIAHALGKKEFDELISPVPDELTRACHIHRQALLTKLREALLVQLRHDLPRELFTLIRETDEFFRIEAIYHPCVMQNGVFAKPEYLTMGQPSYDRLTEAIVHSMKSDREPPELKLGALLVLRKNLDGLDPESVAFVKLTGMDTTICFQARQFCFEFFTVFSTGVLWLQRISKPV
jgi:hypothetical protein